MYNTNNDRIKCITRLTEQNVPPYDRSRAKCTIQIITEQNVPHRWQSKLYHTNDRAKCTEHIQ